MYQVYKDASVGTLSGNNSITDYQEDKFYKLADRKYMIVSSQIKNETQTVSTKRYLLIILDKAGNTLLLNNELNAKTIKPMIISTPTFQFDVANEKLIFGENEIDLKKIIGSTNEYKEVEIAKKENTNESEENKTENNNNQTNNGSSGGGTTVITQTTQNSETTQIINGINNNTDDNNNYDDNNNNDNISNNGNGTIDVEDTNKTPLEKSVNLRSIIPTSSTLIANYNIIDPESKYQTVYLTIDGDISKTIALDKTKNQYVVSGLTPNSEYQVTMTSVQINKDGTTTQNIEDSLTARTTTINSSIRITKLGINKIYFNFKMDSNYVFDSANIALYVDGERVNTLAVNTNQAVKSSGWTSNFTYNYGREIILRVEDAIYNGSRITTDIQAKIKNY